MTNGFRSLVGGVDSQLHRNEPDGLPDPAQRVALGPGTILPGGRRRRPETEEVDMPKKNGGKRGKAGGRAYARLARHERSTIELMLDRGASRRAIAAELGRAPSTVSNEAAAHRFVVAPKAEGRGARARRC